VLPPAIVSVTGHRADVQWALLRAYGTLTKRFGYRGMQRISWHLGRILHEDATLDLEGARLRVGLGDGYWTKLLLGQPYEPELADLLAGELDPEAAFLDCGANIGYWSVLASTRWGAQVVAVEAARSAYQQLVRNNRLNGNRFTPLKAAVWSQERELLTLVTHEWRHAGSSVVNRRDKIGRSGYDTETVETVTIDGLVARHFPDASKVVVKLDVEGAESAAIEGARDTLGTRDVLLVYEDAGSSAGNILRELGYGPVPLGAGNYVALRMRPSVFD
jgi:FkbM family methyltransferase